MAGEEDRERLNRATAKAAIVFVASIVVAGVSIKVGWNAVALIVFFLFIIPSGIAFPILVVALSIKEAQVQRSGRVVSSQPSAAPIVPPPSRTIPQWVKIAVAHRDGGKCRRCGSAYELQYDHIVPYSGGGSSTDVNNIQLLCGRCNRLKSNRYVG
jgi:hypothetical protein